MRKKFIAIRVMKFWNKLPRKVMEVPSPETFRIRLDQVLST